MSDEIDVASIRRMADEPETGTYTDEMLLAFRDAEGGLNAAVAAVWREKAASASSLVTISESGSSRQMGDLYKNALAMAAYYDKLGSSDDGATVDETSAPFTVSVDRQ